MIISSVLFGFTHFLNFLSGENSLDTIIYQVIYTTTLGFVLSLIYLKTESLFVPIILHGIIDFSNTFFNFLGESTQSKGIQWDLLLITAVCIIVAFSYYSDLKNKESKLGFIN